LKPLSKFEKKVINHIRNYDSPTISNSLELIDSSLRSKGHTQKTMHCLNPSLKPIIGFAKTAIITSRKKKNTNIIKNRDKYYEYMFDGNFPKICVIEDKDKTNTIGAWWGELNASIHSKFGFEGAITNGAMRDLQQINKNFQILSGEIRVGHGYNQIHKINCNVLLSILIECQHPLPLASLWQLSKKVFSVSIYSSSKFFYNIQEFRK